MEMVKGIMKNMNKSLCLTLMSLALFAFTSFGQNFSNVQVSLSSSTAGGASTYTITANSAAVLSHNTGDIINVVFPANITTAITAANVTVNGAQPSAVTHTAGTSTLSINLFASNGGADLPAGTVTIVINISNNPATPSSTAYTLTLAANGGTTATSNAYTITSSNTIMVATLPSVTLSNTTVSSVSAYRFRANNFVAHSAGDILYVTFPSGTTLPSSIPTTSVQINNTNPSSISVNTSTRTAALTLGGTVTAGNDSIVFLRQAGISNPPSSGATSTGISLTSNLQPTSSATTTYTLTQASSLTAANITLSPSTQNTVSQYDVLFSVGNSGGLTANTGTITMTFPEGTTIPSSISASNITVNGVNANSVTTDIGNRIIIVTTGTTISVNTAVTVSIKSAAGLVNPLETGTYTLAVKTSSENSNVTSNSYSITQSTITSPTITLSSATPSAANTQYSINFSLGAGGALTANSSTITVSFPSATTLNSSLIDAASIKVNLGSSDESVVVTPSVNTSGQNRIITFTTPVNISNSQNVTIKFTNGITNPATVADYNLSVYTSIETTPQSSENYSITNSTTSVTAFSVTKGSSTRNTSNTYTINFTPTKTLTKKKDNVTVYFPAEYTLGTVGVGGTNSGNFDTPVKSGNNVRLDLNNSANLAAGVAVSFTLSNITNPSTAKTNYKVEINTSQDGTRVQSGNLFIYDNVNVTSVVDSATTNTINTISGYDVSFTNAANSVITASRDTIFVTFGTGTTLPGTISNEYILVNNVPAFSNSISGLTVRIVSPITISAGAAVTVKFAQSAGITNPSTAGAKTGSIKVSPTLTATNDTYYIKNLTQISSASVTPNPTTKASTSTQYTINFTTNNTLTAGVDDITIRFRSGMLPNNTTAQSRYTNIAVNGNTLTTGTDVSVIESDSTLVIRTPSTITSGGSVSVVISSPFGIINPSNSGSYTIQAKTTADNTYVTSGTFSITNSTISTPTVSVSPSTASATNVSYTVDFNTGSGGALTGTSDKIYFIFPVGTTLPSTIANSDVTVNGQSAFAIQVYKTNAANFDTIAVTVPSTITSSTAITVIFGTGAGIQNPSTSASTYSLYVYTDKETISKSSSPYTITSSNAVTNVTVIAGNNLANGSASSYIISFVPNVTLAATNTIRVNFPSGFNLGSTVLTAGANIRVDGGNGTFVNTTAATTISGNTLTVSVPAGAGGFGISNVVRVEFTTAVNILNPTSAKSTYTLSVYTSVGAAQLISSTPFTLRSSNTVTVGNVSTNPSTANTNASYTLAFTTSANGALSVGDSIVFTFPSGTTVPASIPTSSVSVNGIQVTQPISVSGQTVKIRVPNQIAISTSVTVSFTSGSGIINPTNASYTNLSVRTSIDYSSANMNSYTITANSTITAAAVTASPSTVNTVGAYSLNFTNGTTAFATATSDSIVIVFPSGTIIPSSIPTSSVTINGVAVAYVATTPASRIVRIRHGSDIASQAVVNLAFSSSSGITNPSNAGGVSLTVARNNGTATTSNTYTITESQVTTASVSVSPSTATSAGGYSISFSVGAGGALTSSSSSISITFPSGTVLPASIAANNITVNSTPVASSPSINTTTRVLTFTTPVSISNNGSVLIDINSNANIQNPSSAATTYTLGINTSKETTKITSQVYTISSASDISIATVTLSNNIINTGSVYTVKFKSNTAFSNSTRITVAFPSTTSLGGSLNFTSPSANIQIKKNYNGSLVSVDSSGVSGLQVTIKVPTAAGFSSSSDTCYVLFNTGVTNPTTAGTNKTLSIRTATTSFVTSNKFTIVGNSSVSSISVSPSPNTSGSVASYTISFTSTSALFTGDAISLTFPSGTILPGSITADKMSVNSVTTLQNALINGQTITVYVPADINAGGITTVVFNSATGITNPSANTNYVIGVFTSSDNVSFNSTNYTINASSTITSATVTLSNSTVNTVSSYTLTFTNGNTGTIVSGETIVLTFPATTNVPGTITSNVTVNSGSGYVTSNALSSISSNSGAKTITITLASTIATSDPVRIVISSAAGITNPTAPGSSYTISVATQNRGSATSNTYTVVASTVSSATVSLSSTATSASANYTIGFTTGAAGALTTGNTIVVTFPSGTTVSGANTGNVTINGGAPTAVNVSSQVVTLTYSSANSGTISNSGAVSLVFTGLTNPSSANASASVSIYTTAETTPVTSNTYAITLGTTVGAATVTLGNSTANTLSQYTVVFSLGSSGALTTGTTPTISIVFPSGTTLGGSLTTAANTTLNGDTPQTVAVSGQTVTITKTAASATIANGATVTIVFSNAASMITNPTVAQSNYTVGVSTSIEPTIITSNKYKVVAATNTMTAASVTPSNDRVSQPSTYSVSFNTGSNGKLLIGDKVYITFPSGFTISQIASGSVQVNSTPTTVATTVSGQQFAVTMPVNVNASSSILIDLLDATKITNTAAANYYTLDISSDIETATKTSNNFAIYNGDGSLPVELSSFSAKYYRGGSLIEWETESEIQNAFFKLFRREKGDSQFTEVAKIEGQGTVTTKTKYRFIDSKLVAGKVYEYQLKDYGFDGSVGIHDIVSLEIELPKEFTLERNYPNPFNPETVIPFALPVDARVTVEIYNIIGQRVKTLVNEERIAGSYYETWNGKNDQNVSVSSGVYFVVMNSKDFKKSMKIMMLK